MFFFSSFVEISLRGYGAPRIVSTRCGVIGVSDARTRLYSRAVGVSIGAKRSLVYIYAHIYIRNGARAVGGFEISIVFTASCRASA